MQKNKIDFADGSLNELELGALTEHQVEVFKLILQLKGIVRGFPADGDAMYNVVKAWSRFISLEPFHYEPDPVLKKYATNEDRARWAEAQGLIPGEWLISEISLRCKYMPTPAEARAMYCSRYQPLDGHVVHNLLDQSVESD